MLLDLDKFYSSNYKDFVHKEALEEALKFVPEAFLKDVDTKAILSVTFSVDDVGENPIYVTYLGKDNKEHIVKLRPNITDQLTEVLKRYPTKFEMQEALDELKTTVTNEYTIFVNSEVEALNNTINNINNSLTQSIKDTLDEAKSYTDEKHEDALTKITEGDTATLSASKDYTDTKNQETQVGLKNYADTKHEEALVKITEGDTNTLNAATEYTDSLKDELTPVITENKNRLYMANVDGVKNEIEKTGHVTFEVNDGIKAIEVKQNDTEEMPPERVDFSSFALKGDIPENVVTNDYLNTQLENYETKTEASVDHNKLSEVPNNHHQPYISWFPDIDSDYIRMVNDGNETRFHINNSQTKEEKIGYLSSRNPANFATTSDLEPLASKLSNICGNHKAPFIYWVPNIDVNTMKLENTENDVKVAINDGDTVYWGKNPTETMTGDPHPQPTGIANINWYATKGFESSSAFQLSFGQPSITNWSMRLINDTYGDSGWSYKFITGYFTVSVPKLYLTPYNYKVGSTLLHDELRLTFNDSIESWANRSIQIVPAQIKFKYTSLNGESSWVSCFAKIENTTLTLDNFDEHKMKKICDSVENKNLDGTEGTITIRLNGGY